MIFFWLLLGVIYIVIWMGYGWKETMYFQEKEIARKSIYQSTGDVAQEWLAVSLVCGYFIAAIWPITLPVRALYFYLVEKTTVFETLTEKEEREKKELVALRKQAKELGLPLPEVTNELSS